MTISVLLADDNLLIREGVQALIQMSDDIDVIGVASDYEELIEAADQNPPQVLVTDIRMPPNFQKEGIEAAKLVRKMNPGTGVVILSQYDDPEYAISLLAEGSDGYAYLLKDRVAEGDQLARAIREVATGGSMLDPRIVEALTSPISVEGNLDPSEQKLVTCIAEGTPIKAIAATMNTTPADIDSRIEKLWVRLAAGVQSGNLNAINQLKTLQRAIADREEQGEELSRLLPGGVADRLRRRGHRIGETEDLEVTVLMADIRGYSTIAEKAEPSALAGQLNRHRAAMTHAIIEANGTVMQFIGDAVMASFGAPEPMENHADAALAAALAMHEAQAEINSVWAAEGLEQFGLGIGLSTGIVAAALLGSEERLEYTIIGDTVNLSHRLQQWAEPGETIISHPTWEALSEKPETDELEPEVVKGRVEPVRAYRYPRRPS
ncbi:MAG: adenylate/guanylate cyclase domain-containing protein [Acidimicrobiia bacterium]|nr:adenylate/guanylate cyclase domain-containing protein [Acidimicrobiia bacterium]